jgi:hypothetical protein
MNRLRDPHWILILSFLGILVGVPTFQTLQESLQEEGVRVIEAFPQSLAASELRAYERTLESANWAAKLTRPWFQFTQFTTLRDGGSKAVIANDGWYFYKPGLLDQLAPAHPVISSDGTTNDPSSSS